MSEGSRLKLALVVGLALGYMIVVLGVTFATYMSERGVG